MKTKITFLFVAFLFIFGNVFSAEISLSEAERVAENFIYEQTGVPQNSIELVCETFEKNDINYYYIFNIKNGGFVIVSAEDRFDPIIAYSFVHDFKTENQPDNIAWFMNDYVEQIDYCVQNDVSSAKSNKWSHYNVAQSDFSADLTPKTEVVLSTALWDQGYGWNQACPEDPAGPGGRVYAGCVATAMSIVMKYWEYPISGQGSHSYYAYPYGTLFADFANTNYMWEYMEEDDYNWFVALLMYHAGISVNMEYSPDGSGAYSVDADDAFRNNFRYGDATYLSKQSTTTTNWINIIQAQIDAGQPIYYSGQGADGGHAFVADGYRDTDDYIHFNFGWSGSANGFYSHADVNGFSSSQAIIYDIYPTESYYPYSASPSPLTAELDTFNLDDFTVNLSWQTPTSKGLTGYILYRDDEILDDAIPTSVYDYVDDNADIDNHFYGLRAEYTDGISQCSVSDVKGKYNVTFTVLDQNGVGIHLAQVDFAGISQTTGFGTADFINIPFGQDYEYTVSYGIYSETNTLDYLYKNTTIYVTLGPAAINETNQIIVAYPNPSNGILYLSGLDAQNNVNVFDMNGRLVFSQQNVQDNSSIDLTNLSRGVYNVKITSGVNNITHQIVIK
ncbi:MAG: thiol protease/hemagglutinin PrtT [Bacteroidales bacterium]|nr:thiol protease/hemagglutinin PrtT [Bacteroidales bacterium]